MRTSLLSVAALAVAVASGQAVGPAFEAASIRPNPGPWRVLVGYNADGPRLTLEAYSVRDLIVEAYGLESYQLEIASDLYVKDGTPAYFNLAAKAPGEAAPTRAQFREMLQNLLTERFRLRFHRELRETPVYLMTVARNGHKLRESKPDAPKSGNHRVRGRNQTIEVIHATMLDLTREIRMFVDRPVIDRTGLTGMYDIDLEATPYSRLANNPQPEDITMFTAIQDRLGLKLDADKVPLPVMVVDSVTPPTEN